MQQQEHVWHLVGRYLSGDASEESLKELQQIMDTDPLLKNTIELLFQFFYSENNADTAIIEDAWQKHLKRMQSD